MQKNERIKGEGSRQKNNKKGEISGDFQAHLFLLSVYKYKC